MLTTLVQSFLMASRRGTQCVRMTGECGLQDTLQSRKGPYLGLSEP